MTRNKSPYLLCCILGLSIFLKILNFSHGMGTDLAKTRRYRNPSLPVKWDPFSYNDMLDFEVDKKCLNREIAVLFKTGKMGPLIEEIFSSIDLKKMTNRYGGILRKKDTKDFYCNACWLFVWKLYTNIHSGVGFNVNGVAWVLTQLCQIKFAKRVCEGVMKDHAPLVYYILWEKQSVDFYPAKVCSILLQGYGCTFQNNSLKSEWKINTTPGPKICHRTHQFQQPRGPLLKILHFSDPHIDDIYKAGGNPHPDCGEPICCGTNQGEPADPKKGCGYWGDHRESDMPWHTLEMTLKEMAKQKYDALYYTGDTISHRFWEESREANMAAIKKLHKMLRDAFPGTPVFPILGNHDTHPVNAFAPIEITNDLSTNWLFDMLLETWAPFLPNSTFETLKRGGFYTTLLKPGLRIIGLNSMVCYILNMWLNYNEVDPYGQLQWLQDTLAAAEKNNEIVHILTHIATGDSTCYIKWAEEYVKITHRYNHIIAAQFNGHTHVDDFEVFYKDKVAYNVLWNGGSTNTYIGNNPNYKVYSIHPQNYKVEDFDSYTFDMTEANLSPQVPPKWFKLYSFKAAFGATDLTDYKQIDSVVRRIATDRDIFFQYYKFCHRGGPFYKPLDCHKDCVEKLLCNLVSTVYLQNDMCEELWKISFVNNPKENANK